MKSIGMPAIAGGSGGVAVAAVAVDEEALLAVVHAQRDAAIAALDHLHAKEACREGRPVLELVRGDADVSQRLKLHHAFSLPVEKRE